MITTPLRYLIAVFILIRRPQSLTVTMTSPPQSLAQPRLRLRLDYSADVYSKYRPRPSQHVTSISPSASHVTVHGSTFAGGSNDHNGYFVGAIHGLIGVWDVTSSINCGDAERAWQLDGGGIPQSCGSMPSLYVRVVNPKQPTNYNTKPHPTNNVLYDIQFIRNNTGQHLLIVSGDPGILIYKWSDVETAIQETTDRMHSLDPPRRTQPVYDILPLTCFHPHPSPATLLGETIEFNSSSYDGCNNILYGAAGDSFGCYQWDLGSERLLGTFGGCESSFNGRLDLNGHGAYLHVVKAMKGEEGIGSGCLITGGEGGTVGFWNGKDRKLIQMVNIQETMEKSKQLVTGQLSSNRGFKGNTSNTWVSSVDTSNNGNWLAICGGADNGHGIGGRPTTSGFMTLWHLPTRTLTSGCITRESIYTVVFHPSLHFFVTGGNEGRISFWESTSATRVGRSWCSSQATHTVSVGPDVMVAGGYGRTLDCFVDRVKVSQLGFGHEIF